MRARDKCAFEINIHFVYLYFIEFLISCKFANYQLRFNYGWSTEDYTVLIQEFSLIFRERVLYECKERNSSVAVRLVKL